MSCSQNPPTLTLTAGQKCPLPLVFTQPDGSPVDLTDTTVRLVAKRDLGDPDAEAVIDWSQAEHAAPESGATALDADLSEIGEEIYAKGLRLTAGLWLVDSGGNRIPYGEFAVEIQPSVLRWTSEE